MKIMSAPQLAYRLKRTQNIALYEYPVGLYSASCYFRFAHPIYVDGEYPPIMQFQINIKKNTELNRTEPRLPSFTQEEKEMVKGWQL